MMNVASNKKKDYMWNTVAGIMKAMQSAIILIFISRGLGAEAAGIFTIGYALANLFYTIGKYAIRTYQVTDIKEENSFADYLLVRGISVFIAILLMIFYVTNQYYLDHYTYEKVVIVVLLVIWKMIDAYEDVFYGMYQQRNRLDLASKCYSIRLLISSLLYCILVMLGISLIVSTAITVIFSIVIAVVMIKSTWKQFNVCLRGVKKQNVKRLLYDCFPSCIGASLSIYVGNIPKYLIDAHMDETTQAYFGFLMMPSFVSLMLSGFIYQPMARDFGVLWNENEHKKIIMLIGKVMLIISGFTAIVILGGMWIGLDILSWLYGVDLSSFEIEFFVLLVGGGVFAMVNFLAIPITSIRIQKNIAIGFGIASIIGLTIGNVITINYGMFGVSIMYLIQNVFLCLYFCACLLIKLYQKLKDED